MARKRKNAEPQATRRDSSAPGPEDADEPATERADDPDGESLDDIHAEALKRYQRGYEKDRENQSRAYEDLKFLAGENQWDEKARQERDDEGRPVLVVNKVPQFVRQVTGDIRQMRPAVKVVPIDDAADKDIAAKILPGMIRYIEQRSDAQGAYYHGADQAVAAGVGHWRVLTEYASTRTFDQEIRISPIEDGIGVVWDPDSTLPDRSDAMFCFVPVDMSKAAAEDRWEDKGFEPLDKSPECFLDWYSDDHVRVTEYWCKHPIIRKLAVYPDGKIEDITDADDATLADTMALNPRIEERDGFKLVRYVISAREVIEGPEDWPGPDIPIVPLFGEEIVIGRTTVRRGVVRNLHDVQRSYNYAISTDVESVALQPKAPFKGTRKNFEKYRDQWETANSRNWPYLEYEPDPANGGVAPQREAPPIASSGIKELLTVTSADMSAVTGIYPAALGAQSNEISGKAIMARQREGDTGTYLYVDNFARAVRRTGQILVNLIPKIYDSQRTIRIAGEDGKIDMLRINHEQIDPNGDGIATKVLHDVTVGAYEVSVEMGASYATKREEARDGMAAFMQASGPQVAALYIDLFAKMQDWPLADKIAKRAQLMLPQPIQMMEAQESGEPPPQMPQMPPSPEQQAAMAEQQKANGLEQSRQQLDMAKIQVEQQKVQAELEKARLGHDAAMAGHAASIRTAETTASAAQPQPDPRVDQLAQAVDHLNQMVMQIAQAISAPPQPPQPPPPEMQIHPMTPDNGGGMPPAMPGMQPQ
jgi:hypothetical protein